MYRDFGLLLSITSLVVLLHFIKHVGSNKPQVPCYFIFGDSLVDSGNNNQLNNSKWKANYPPYGIDFPKGHSGRFTNGRTFADIIGKLLGFDEFIPPYVSATDDQISKGVNYASGGAGIREDTGKHNGDCVNLDRQLLNHNTTISRISRIQKNTTFLDQCIYVMGIGSSDYFSNYFNFDDYYTTPKDYGLDGYADILVEKYTKQLKNLYNMGARKIVLFGLTRLGCTPFAVKKWTREWQPCSYLMNDAIHVFNERLKPLVDELNKEKSDARFIFINTTSILHREEGAPGPPPSSPVANAIGATSQNIYVGAHPCCPADGEWACNQNSVPCPTRSSSIYFDNIHPTEPTHIAIAERSYKAVLPTDVYPYDIHHLVEA